MSFSNALAAIATASLFTAIVPHSLPTPGEAAGEALKWLPEQAGANRNHTKWGGG